MSEKLELRARALDKALTLAAANKGETSAEQLIADAFVISAYLKGLEISVVSGDFHSNRSGLSVHDSNRLSVKGGDISSIAGDVVGISDGKIIRDAGDQSLAGQVFTHSSSSSVLADGDSGDSVAVDPRNNGTPDTSEKGVNSDD